MNTDRWFFRVFQSAPDLICSLRAQATGSAPPQVSHDGPVDQLYRFSAPELKALSHRLDGVLWPRHSSTGTPEHPVVILEVQMQSDPGFHHRLAAESFRFLQQHPQVEHWAVLLITPHNRLKLGPTQALRCFLDHHVARVNLETLGQSQQSNPLVNLLTLPVLPESQITATCQAILDQRPELVELIVPILMERFTTLSVEDIMVIIGTPIDELRHTRAAQQLIDEGREEGEARGEARGIALGEAAVILRLLNRRCGPLSPETTSTIQALPLERLDALAEALLDFTGPQDLAAWLSLNN